MKLKLATGLLISVFALICGVIFAADSDEFNEGFEYTRVIPPQPTTAGKGQVEVVEIFWFGCPHCYRFEPHLQKWLKTKPKYVKFLRIPAQFRDTWTFHARAFYTARVLKLDHKFDGEFFNEVHKKDNFLDTKEKLIPFFKRFGVSKEKFLATFNSKEVDEKIKHAKEMVENYRVDGVPTVIVNGKYRASTRVLDSNDPKFLRLLNFLVEKEKKAMK